MTGKTKQRLRIAAVAILIGTVAATLYAAGIKTDPIKWGTNSIPLWGAVAASGGGLSLLMLLISAGELLTNLSKFMPFRGGK